MKIKNFATLLLLITTSSWGQQGPVVSCSNCEDLNKKSMPISGSWFNPNQSGTGYILDVKKKYVSGLYFGYDSTGEPLWLSFQGDLDETTDAPHTNWILNARLVSISGGNAFNQEYQFPELQETSDQIKIEFHFAHYASVQINEGQMQHIIPVNYAVPTETDFEETDHNFPELEGIWSFVVSQKDDNNLRLFAYSGFQFYMTPKEIQIDDETGTKTINYGLMFTSTSLEESVVFTKLACSNPVNSDTNQREVQCWIDDIPPLDGRMIVAPGDIGPDYVFGQNENGDIVELFRFNHLPNYGNISSTHISKTGKGK